MTKDPRYTKFSCFDPARSWCPLKGPLPPKQITDEFSPKGQEGRCLQVILEARELAEFEGGYGRSFLRTSRTIYESYGSVYQHTLMDNAHMIDRAKRAADFVRDFHLGLYFDDDVSDYLIWAVLAIATAWIALESILIGRLGRESWVIEQVQDAQELLRIAHEAREYDKTIMPLLIEREERIVEREERIESLRDRAKAGGQAVSQKAELRRQDWQRAANEYWGKNPEASKSAVAMWVVSLIDRNLSDFPHELVDGKRTSQSLKQQIERSIKNPS